MRKTLYRRSTWVKGTRAPQHARAHMKEQEHTHARMHKQRITHTHTHTHTRIKARAHAHTDRRRRRGARAILQLNGGHQPGRHRVLNSWPLVRQAGGGGGGGRCPLIAHGRDERSVAGPVQFLHVLRVRAGCGRVSECPSAAQGQGLGALGLRAYGWGVERIPQGRGGFPMLRSFGRRRHGIQRVRCAVGCFASAPRHLSHAWGRLLLSMDPAEDGGKGGRRGGRAR